MGWPWALLVLPGGVGRIPARLAAWRRGPDGWIADVVLEAPAAAVQPVPGEDYAAVSRPPAPAAASGAVRAPGPGASPAGSAARVEQ